MLNMYITPTTNAAPIIQLINQSTKYIDVNAYMLTDTSILRALQQADNRGVRIRVILEEQPYFRNVSKRQQFVAQELRNLQNIGATVVSSPSYFTFDHAKYICNSFECELGSPNFTWSAFHRNREYFIVTTQYSIVNTMHQLFNADYSRTSFTNTNQQLIISPKALNKIVKLIKQPGKVYLEEEELGSNRKVLTALANKGSLAYIILPSSAKYNDRRNISYLTKYGVNIKFMPRSTYMHAKMIDGKYAGFIGSENLSTTSLTKNREVGIYLTQSQRQQAYQQFIEDWQQATTTTSSSYY